MPPSWRTFGVDLKLVAADGRAALLSDFGTALPVDANGRSVGAPMALGCRVEGQPCTPRFGGGAARALQGGPGQQQRALLCS